MPRRSVIVFILSLFLLTIVAGAAYAAKDTKAKVSDKYRINKVVNGSEDLSGVSTAPSFGTTMSPGVQMGATTYDYQHNGSMGRQVAFKAVNNYVHFVWMRGALTGEENQTRKIAYNAYNTSTAVWALGSGPTGGKVFPETSADIGGYATCDVDNSGRAVVAFHGGENEDLYRSMVDDDASAPLGFFSFQTLPGPLTCEGWVTGAWETESNYLWPVVAYQDSAGIPLFHVVSAESPGCPGTCAGEIQTLVYYRDRNRTAPACGMAIDSVYDIAQIVTASTTGKVAIVWEHPIYYEDDPLDPCGRTQWQNDVVYLESTTYGKTWNKATGKPWTKNVTDYAGVGKPSIEKQPDGQAYTDLAAMYDSGGKLHIVWNTALRDVAGSNPCIQEIASRIWHWDDVNQCISIVYDASRPSEKIDPGAWNLSTAKMSVAECDGNIYVSFTRFGAYASANGDTNLDNSAAPNELSNGEIFLTASKNGGLSYGQAINLTNTPTPNCAAGACESDHWSSMAKYSTGNLHIQYINDKDAGGLPQTEGSKTTNPVMYLTHECFTPADFCAVGYTPSKVGYPTFISPTGASGCTGKTKDTVEVNLVNVGNQNTNVTLSESVAWLTAIDPATVTLQAGCGNTAKVRFELGPIAVPDTGIKNTTITVSACGGAFTAQIPVELSVFCKFYIPENEILSTSCWSIGVWSDTRTGGTGADETGQMWFPEDSATFMYDESIILTFDNDTNRTSFSIFDGSNDEVYFRALGPLVTQSFANYEYAHGTWCTKDTAIIGEADFYLPTHPDTCVLIERVKVCNPATAAGPITISIGEGIDWDIVDTSGTVDNNCSVDAERREVYQSGPTGTAHGGWVGTVSTCHENPGAIVLENDVWVKNSGYKPAEIGGLVKRHTGFVAADPDTAQDLSSLYIITQHLTLAPGQCYRFCKVKVGTKDGLAAAQALINKGKEWILANGLDCGSCEPIGGGPGCAPGDANGAGDPPVDIDDIVYLINFVFGGGPEPVGALCCGDANAAGDPPVDIDDIVYLINFVFGGGPAPLPAC